MKALAFSGGKDSWACLWLNRDALESIRVIWVNTGKNYPEILASIATAKSLCRHFIEIQSDRGKQNADHGIPADVVPIDWTRAGQQLSSSKAVMIQSYLQCCFESISRPMLQYCKDNGIDELIRGQRADDRHKSLARDGDVVDGILYRHPIETWTSAQVVAYVSQFMPLPDHFRFNHTSMDCYDCTAYARDSADRIAYMREQHPLLYLEYARRKAALNDAIRDASHA